MEQLLNALSHSHKHGVIHRDIKPANIIVMQDYQIKVTDFGIANLESSELTQVGTLMGTPTYMSPEQVRGEKVDFHSDLFSAGVIFYQLLTGEKPFYAQSMTAIMHKVLHENPIQPSILNPQIPFSVDEVIQKALAKLPSDRYHSADTFKTAIKSILTNEVDQKLNEIQVSKNKNAFDKGAVDETASVIDGADETKLLNSNDLHAESEAPKPVNSSEPEKTIIAPKKIASDSFLGPEASPAPFLPFSKKRAYPLYLAIFFLILFCAVFFYKSSWEKNNQRLENRDIISQDILENADNSNKTGKEDLRRPVTPGTTPGNITETTPKAVSVKRPVPPKMPETDELKSSVEKDQQPEQHPKTANSNIQKPSMEQPPIQEMPETHEMKSTVEKYEQPEPHNKITEQLLMEPNMEPKNIQENANLPNKIIKETKDPEQFIMELEKMAAEE
jgi:serine/threonine protein kinase